MPVLSPTPIVSLSPLRGVPPSGSDGSAAAYEPAATTPTSGEGGGDPLSGARATSAWSPRPRSPGLGGRHGQVRLSWPLAVGVLLAVALVSGGVGYAVSEARPRGGGDGGGGISGAVSPTATATPSESPSTSATPTASHTAGVSASGTATDTATASVSATPSTSSSAVPTRSMEPSPTSASGVAAQAAALMVTGPRVAFLALGDWGRCATNADPPARRPGGNCDRQRSLVPNMEEWAAAGALDFIMSTGDQFYNGPTGGDGDLRWQYSFREVYNTPLLRSLKWYIVQGNHDWSGELQTTLRWGERAPHADGEEWDVRWHAPSLNYSLTLPLPGGSGAGDDGRCVAFTWLDTVPFMDVYRNGNAAAGPTRSPSTNLDDLFFAQLEDAVPGDQLAWLAAALVNGSQSCAANVVVGHHAVYGSGMHAISARQQDLRARLAFPAVFAWLGVDSYFNGHDHVVEHCVDDGGGTGVVTDYITTGAGSEVRTGNAPVPQSRFLLEDNGFVVSSFNATHGSHIFVAGDGSVAHAVLAPLNAKLRTGGTGAPQPTVPWFAGGLRAAGVPVSGAGDAARPTASSRVRRQRR